MAGEGGVGEGGKEQLWAEKAGSVVKTATDLGDKDAFCCCWLRSPQLVNCCSGMGSLP